MKLLMAQHDGLGTMRGMVNALILGLGFYILSGILVYLAWRFL